MKKRWLVNLALLLVIIGISVFLHLRATPKTQAQNAYEVSSLKLGSFNKLSIEFPAKAPVVFEKVDGYWQIAQPYKARADQMSVQRVLSIVAATSSDKFPANDLARFGLDNPRLKLKLDNEEFLFGTYNPVSSDQYVQYKDSVYLIPSSYSESASVQVVEFIDKSPMKLTEKITGFDFSKLEQWEAVHLNVDLVDGKWKVSVPNAKPTQNDMNEWFDGYWSHMSVSSVEPYTPNRKTTYPSFEVKLKDGSKVHFDKMQESPELLLARPDEGMIYHIAQDVGFTLLNPPVGLTK
ncbi:MAG TPA: DUF4340 domain-containing protein [Methylophilaceae bacterium]|jgi:hypothetical protein